MFAAGQVVRFVAGGAEREGVFVRESAHRICFKVFGVPFVFFRESIEVL